MPCRHRFTFIIVIVLIVSLCLSACFDQKSSALPLSENTVGEFGNTYAGIWFDFTVESANEIDSYAGYSPQEGGILYDVIVKQIGNDSNIPLGTFDFFLVSHEFDGQIYPLDPIDDTMMPIDFTLSKGEERQSHLVFELPEEYKGVYMQYAEYNSDSNSMLNFTIQIV